VRVPEPVATVRRAVREALAALPPSAANAPFVRLEAANSSFAAPAEVLVACSGGADSLALAAAAVHVAPGRVHGVVVDHGLQEGSAARAADTVALLRDLGATAEVVTVEVGTAGGPEAAARTARYAALRAVSGAHGGAPVLLGHTLDDQAETVLLGLGRGSGARSLAGMATWDAPWCRPLLGVRRATTRAACAAAGLAVWDDPHNDDPRHTRVRLRHEVLPLLEDVLAGGVAPALARTAGQLADDDAALVRWADARRGVLVDADGALDAVELRADPPAVRRRVLRAWLADAGVAELTEAHVRAVDALVAAWRGQGAPPLPGGLEVVRARGRLRVLGGPDRAPGAAEPALREAPVPPPPPTLPTQTPVRSPSTVYDGDIASVLITEEQIQDKIVDLAAQIGADHSADDQDLVLVGVLKGAVMFMTDLARRLPMPTQLEFMAVSSYGSSTSSSGVVRILKDLDRDISGRRVLIVEDIIDSGLTLSWLRKNLESRGPASLEVVTLLRKPEAAKLDVDVAYVGFDIPNEFVVGFGLDYAERYRDLPYIGTLDPHVYA
jgi:tRNA(Ile)-lysidine synthase